MLAARGADVAVLDLAPGAAPSPLLRYRADVSDDASVRSAVDAAATDLGGVDILVNNAGVGATGTIEDNDDAQWQAVFDVNVTGIVRTSRAALPHLRRSGSAAVVNTCSIAATAGLPQRALYSASKGAVLSLTLAMAADHIREGIRVNCVNPGTVDTPWVGRLLGAAQDPAAERAALEARQPSGRLVHSARSGRSDRLPRQSCRGVHHRNRARRGRRHGRTATAPGRPLKGTPCTPPIPHARRSDRAACPSPGSPTEPRPWATSTAK
ncbi:short chain dehydrogenase/reductase family oxidoreductase [Streptomyces sp. e14]|nr:short chain dehydrogenase/reductase family oxidoreductase [Streptomyces sp. e14]